MRRAALTWMVLATALAAVPTNAERVSDVRGTKHNLSVSGPGNVKALSETQVCVFCHTPHGGAPAPTGLLWNRQLSGATYTAYQSSSIEADIAELSLGPGGTSKLCLSCHDGTLAIGNVNVLNATGPATVALQGTAADGTMPSGAGADTGFTRRLGVDLTNDHPISFTFDAALAARDGELRAPDGVKVGNRLVGVSPKPVLPLDAQQVQCTSCHDPHVRDNDPAKGNIKFLRANRFQEAPATGGAYSPATDIICLGCHDKAGQTWAASAHANPLVATQLYTLAASTQREFPDNAPVWKTSCLNCHDTHTVRGARRLLREGTDSLAQPKSGGNSAIEETCYQCHAPGGQSILTSTATVPDIKTDFALPRRMPINAQPEVHDIGTGEGSQRGKDFVESPALIGKTNMLNRHAECTDCHNPHRVIKNRLFNGDANIPDAAGTHAHAPGRSNIASGVLKGTTGVEPVYGSASFTSPPLAYLLKRGDGGTAASSAVQSAWVTREYQVCLKCHSDYAYTTPPSLGDSPGGTPSGTNGLTVYTNQAIEFQAPLAHQGETTTSDSGAAPAYGLNNHRSWHPVINPTGRPHTVRRTTPGSFVAPFANDVGTQTMYCSECHGSSTADGTIVPDGGENGNAWGPHGSTNDFILKGLWNSATGTNAREGGFTANALCFKCHERNTYASRNGGGSSGFSTSGGENLHALHTDKIERLRCTWCHVAVPHGWKNKALLVNLNDVGPEVGLPSGTQVRNNTTAPYNRAPYYLNSVLKIRTFARSGNWSEANCGSAGAPGNGQSGRDWMRDSSENCANLP